MTDHSLAPPGFLPLLRRGDLLFTAMALYHEMTGRTSVSRAAEAVWGSRNHNERGLFGQNILEASWRVFGESARPRQILEDHTLVGLYSRFLPKGTAEKCFDALASGRKNCCIFTHRLNPNDRQRLYQGYLRSCPRCVESDNQTQGFAAWRVVHQIPWIDHCPEHGARLLEELAPGPNSRGRVRLPRGYCDRPSNKEPIPISNGYAIYLGIWPKILSGELSCVEHGNWMQLMERHMYSFSLDELSARIEQDWGMSDRKLAHTLRLQGDFLSWRITEKPQEIAAQVVSLAVLLQLGVRVHGMPHQPETPDCGTIHGGPRAVEDRDTSGNGADKLRKRKAA